jgi:hypothetical protein
MAKDDPQEIAAPTMIIPRGTEIEVDAHGQLSVRAPGNLVIQHSGSYGTLESRSGSIRIDQGVEVEAVSVSCAGDCFVQGSLTAWKVTARALQLEESARANIVLQETERLEVGRDARLVGNFDSEKELFLLFSRFAREFRSLPFFFERREGSGRESGGELPAAPARRLVEVEGDAGDELDDAAEEERGAAPRPQASPADLPEPLFFSLVLLERDAERGDYGHTSQRVLSELIKLLQQGDVETLRLTYRTLLGRIVDPRADVRRAEELIDGFFTDGAEMRPPRGEG